MTNKATLTDILKIQLEQLTEWSEVLNTEAYLLLLKKAMKENAKGYSDPYHVWRGTDMSNFIANLYRNDKGVLVSR